MHHEEWAYSIGVLENRKKKWKRRQTVSLYNLSFLIIKATHTQACHLLFTSDMYTFWVLRGSPHHIRIYIHSHPNRSHPMNKYCLVGCPAGRPTGWPGDGDCAGCAWRVALRSAPLLVVVLCFCVCPLPGSHGSSLAPGAPQFRSICPLYNR